jgi:hypothetical protein
MYGVLDSTTLHSHLRTPMPQNYTSWGDSPERTTPPPDYRLNLQWSKAAESTYCTHTSYAVWSGAPMHAAVFCLLSPMPWTSKNGKN